ncbi:hypothetical protein DPMN_191171 [Dreissena polymorpha]|uniref:Nucleic-acid-binding protein from transposon X-element n=1 Tax=Dreissena polymorpha TaxID=45954 RepID=A0A9D3Y0U6_DREPO|nr:hypothetical protein DPMN_191171 [Dreissena polymorpha]
MKTYANVTATLMVTPKIQKSSFRAGDLSIDSETGTPYTVTLTPKEPLTPNQHVTRNSDPSPDTIPDSIPNSPQFIATLITNDATHQTNSTPSKVNQTLNDKPVKVPNKSPRPQSTRQSNHYDPGQAIWLTLCLGTVAAIFPRDKAKAIGDAFVKFVGSEQTKPLKEVKAGLLFKIRKDAITKAHQFSYGNYDFKLTEQPKLGKGIIHVPLNANIEKLKNELKSKPNVEAVHSGARNKFITVTFKSENAPTNILGHNVKPALFASLRCFKCQMFGHASHVCKNNAKCPHCADNHSHASCTSRNTRKCANCGGGHSAAYKGCPVYLKYQTTINNKNLRLTNNYLHNMSTTNQRPNLEQIAKQLVGKSEAEILTILKNKFPEKEAEQLIIKPTPPVQPSPTPVQTTKQKQVMNPPPTQQQQSQQAKTHKPTINANNPVTPKQQQQTPLRTQFQRHNSQPKSNESSPLHIHRKKLNLNRYRPNPIIMRHSQHKRQTLAPPFPIYFRHAYGLY